ncbi:MAG: DUF202 domain-containing protein [Vannielia sp.]|uniref:YidH family protein n=1 Tax=Rhodobacterales TaxID=204455 RepID=UPI00209654CC|nr:DUF202 domain-containing protein [Oceanicola sp. 502str15]MCO6383903.1 DUF202 domain-containing protein [Oceanicola sp. 502str15]
MQDGCPEDPDTKTEWAESRTDWAEDRTLQANERTFAGWMRTGLGAVAVAIGLKAVFGDFDPTWAAKAVASLFILAALVIFWFAQRNARRTHHRLEDHAAEPMGHTHFTLVAAIFAFASAAVGFVLWSL